MKKIKGNLNPSNTNRYFIKNALPVDIDQAKVVGKLPLQDGDNFRLVSIGNPGFDPFSESVTLAYFLGDIAKLLDFNEADLKKRWRRFFKGDFSQQVDLFQIHTSDKTRASWTTLISADALDAFQESLKRDNGKRKDIIKHLTAIARSNPAYGEKDIIVLDCESQPAAKLINFKQCDLDCSESKQGQPDLPPSTPYAEAKKASVCKEEIEVESIPQQSEPKSSEIKKISEPCTPRHHLHPPHIHKGNFNIDLIKSTLLEIKEVQSYYREIFPGVSSKQLSLISMKLCESTNIPFPIKTEVSEFDDDVFFTQEQIADKIGLFSDSGRPHSQFVGGVLEQIGIKNNEIFYKTAHLKEGGFPYRMYHSSVVYIVKRWAEDKLYPGDTPRSSLGFNVVYQPK